MTAARTKLLLWRWATACARALLHVAMWVGVWLMWSASATYWELGDSHPFFLEKLPLTHPTWWRVALYVHVPSALIALPSCLLLLVGRLRIQYPAVHRWLGRVTGGLILCAVVPSGMYLAWFAQGGLLTTFGFSLSGVIAFVAMLKSIGSARRRDMRAHRRFSLHVALQLSVAVISRFLLVGAEELGWYDESAYSLALLVPVLGAVITAELWTSRRLRPISKGARHEVVSLASHLPALRQHGAGRAAAFQRNG